MSTISEARFDLFDSARLVEAYTIDGVSMIGNRDRTLLADLGHIEPHDDRDDGVMSVPMRSAIHAGCGPAFELGPFDLDPADAVRLYNALADHMRRFPDDFSRSSS